MTKLVNEKGLVDFGIYPYPIHEINSEDFLLKTPMGKPRSKFIKKLMVNQFFFIGINSPGYMAGLAIADLKYVTNGFFYIYDISNNKLVESTVIKPSSKKIYITSNPEAFDAQFKTGKLVITMKDGEIHAQSKDISVNVKLDLKNRTPLRICSKAGYRGWVYTQKTLPVKAEGDIVIDKKKIDLDPDKTLVLMDWTKGFMRRKTFWHWASTATYLPDGRSFGFNLSCGVNETSFTENFVMVDGNMTKVDMVNFSFDEQDLYKTWHITSYDKKINLLFKGKKDRSEKKNLLLATSNFTQLVGFFEGSVKLDNGETVEIRECPGWAEDHYAKW